MEERGVVVCNKERRRLVRVQCQGDIRRSRRQAVVVAVIKCKTHGVSAWMVGESVVLELSDEAVDLLLRYHAGRDLAILPRVCHPQGLPR